MSLRKSALSAQNTPVCLIIRTYVRISFFGYNNEILELRWELKDFLSSSGSLIFVAIFQCFMQ